MLVPVRDDGSTYFLPHRCKIEITTTGRGEVLLRQCACNGENVAMLRLDAEDVSSLIDELVFAEAVAAEVKALEGISE